jgi:predicted O-methyltransferase YrrM
VSDKFFQAKAYLSYWLDAVDEHSLHSPFFFDFYTRVVKKRSSDNRFENAETLRKKLLQDTRILTDDDPGSGSSQNRSIASIAKHSLTPQHLSIIYDATIDFFKAKNIIELGTSLGINSLYLASKKERSVVTFEGSKEVSEIARLTFEFAKATNIQLVEGNIDQTLRPYVESVRKTDFILLDANHRYEPTIRYFNVLIPRLHEGSVVIIDDIHYSVEMERAWKELMNHKLVYGSADLFRCGILFFDPSLNKQHVILQV